MLLFQKVCGYDLKEVIKKSTYKFGSKKVCHITYDCEEWENLSDNRVLIK